MRFWLVALLLVPPAGAEEATFYLHGTPHPVWALEGGPHDPPDPEGTVFSAWSCTDGRATSVGDFTLSPPQEQEDEVRFHWDGDVGFGHPFRLATDIDADLPLEFDLPVVQPLEMEARLMAGNGHYSSLSAPGDMFYEAPTVLALATLTLEPEPRAVTRAVFALEPLRHDIAYDENWVLVLELVGPGLCLPGGPHVRFHASQEAWPTLSFTLEGGHGVQESRPEGDAVRAEFMSWAGAAWVDPQSLSWQVDLRAETSITPPAEDQAYHHSIRGFSIGVRPPASAPDGEHVASIVLDGHAAFPVAWFAYEEGRLVSTCGLHDGHRACVEDVQETTPWPAGFVVVALLLARRTRR